MFKQLILFIFLGQLALNPPSYASVLACEGTMGANSRDGVDGVSYPASEWVQTRMSDSSLRQHILEYLRFGSAENVVTQQIRGFIGNRLSRASRDDLMRVYEQLKGLKYVNTLSNGPVRERSNIVLPDQIRAYPLVNGLVVAEAVLLNLRGKFKTWSKSRAILSAFLNPLPAGFALSHIRKQSLGSEYDLLVFIDSMTQGFLPKIVDDLAHIEDDLDDDDPVRGLLMRYRYGLKRFLALQSDNLPHPRARYIADMASAEKQRLLDYLRMDLEYKWPVWVSSVFVGWHFLF